MRFVKMLTMCLTIGALATSTMAQPGGAGRGERGPRGQRGQQQARLAPEDAKAAWTLEAKGVAAGLKLSEEQTEAVIKAYVAARENHNKAVQAFTEKMREQRRGGEGVGAGGGVGAGEGRGAGDGAGRGQRRGGGGRGMGGAMAAEREELMDKSRAALKTSLGEVLADDQLKRAARILGTFDPTWDRMVHAIAGMELDEKKTAQSLKAIQGYVVTRAKLRGSGDREGLQTAMRDSREKFDEKMAAILDEEQLRAFRRASGARGGRGAGGRGGPGGGGGMAARLESMDTNGDGKIQRSEMPERMLPMFDRLDTNGDGVIDKAEIEAAGEAMGNRDRGRRGGRGGGVGGGGTGNSGGGGGTGGGSF